MNVKLSDKILTFTMKSAHAFDAGPVGLGHNERGNGAFMHQRKRAGSRRKRAEWCVANGRAKGGSEGQANQSNSNANQPRPGQDQFHMPIIPLF
jgi:hypothetical protein